MMQNLKMIKVRKKSRKNSRDNLSCNQTLSKFKNLLN